MSSKDLHNTLEVLEDIVELTGEKCVLDKIVEPIRAAAKSFAFEEAMPITHGIFWRVTSDFVRHVYEHGLVPGQVLQVWQARAEVLAILEEGYYSVEARGYYAAILDALDPRKSGLGPILTQMEESIIHRAESKYVRWVYSSRIDPSNWHAKCLIAEMLLERFGHVLPSSVLACAPSQLTGSLPELFEVLRSADSVVRKAIGADDTIL